VRHYLHKALAPIVSAAKKKIRIIKEERPQSK